MNFTLHQLQVFLKVTRTGSITKAARELHLTQPAVSIQIRNLQDQFEIPLLEVIGKKIFITDFGKEIALVAEKISGDIDLVQSRAAAYKGQLIGRLKVTSVSTGKYVMPYFLSGFVKQHPGTDLVLDVSNRDRVLQCLEQNETDFALLSVLPDPLKVDQIELMENKLYMVSSREQEVRKGISVGQLFEEIPLIFREPGSGTRQIMEKFIKQHHLSVNKKMELTSNEAVKQAVIADLGYSVMPLIGMRKELDSGDLQIVPIAGFPIKSTWRLVWLKDKKLSPVGAAFRDYIENEKDRIIKEKFT